MNEPAALHVAFQPSRIAGTAVVVGVAATAALVAWRPIDSWVRAITVLFLGAYGIALNRSWAQRSTSHAVVAIVVDANRRIVVIARGGRRFDGDVQEDSYVGAVLSTVVWRGADERRSGAIAILADMLPAEDFRKLRVLLRLGQPKSSPATTPERR
jgi:hypothetical protein